MSLDIVSSPFFSQWVCVIRLLYCILNVSGVRDLVFRWKWDFLLSRVLTIRAFLSGVFFFSTESDSLVIFPSLKPLFCAILNAGDWFHRLV